MNEKYRKLMEQQHLSEESRQTFYNSLYDTQKKKPQLSILKTAAIAICVILLFPITVYAIENIFGISLVEVISGNTTTGYEVNYSDLISRPLSDFSKEVQSIDGDLLVVHNSWKEAEEKLGITLVNNSILSDKNIIKEYSYNLKTDGYENVHCFANYNGVDNQLYRATITAAYRHRGMQVILRSTVTCEHPSIPDEAVNQYHWSSSIYESDEVTEISQEEYTAKNGIQTTIVSTTRVGSQTIKYEANFAANGASYRITLTTFDAKRNDEAKANLIEILEAFVF